MKKINQGSSNEEKHFVEGSQGAATEDVTIDQRLELCRRGSPAEGTANVRGMWTANRSPHSLCKCQF